MTTKIITDYVSNSTEKLKYRMQTKKAQEKYKERMPNSEPKFAYNKHTLKYRQYPRNRPKKTHNHNKH